MISAGKVKVLVVDDEPDLREMIAARFRVFGFDTSTAHSGNQAWNVILSSPEVHIMITDVKMADGSGIELLKKVKERNADSPRVFMVTAYADVPVEDFYEMGAEGFLGKPFDTRILVDTIRKALLARQNQWAMDTLGETDVTIESSFPSLEDAEDDLQFQMGRGGFYIQSEASFPAVGQPISFKIEAHPLRLNGKGIVRWARPDKVSGQFYAGIEIGWLDKETLSPTVGWVQERLPVPFIPKPPKRS